MTHGPNFGPSGLARHFGTGTMPQGLTQACSRFDQGTEVKKTMKGVSKDLHFLWETCLMQHRLLFPDRCAMWGLPASGYRNVVCSACLPTLAWLVFPNPGKRIRILT